MGMRPHPEIPKPWISGPGIYLKKLTVYNGDGKPMNMKMNINTICIIGGGSTAHTLIPLLAHSGKNITLLTRRPSLWSKTVQFNYETKNGEVITSCKGSLQKITDNPMDVIPDADMIILCMPVSSYHDALNNIGPLINPNRSILIGTIYGQGGFNWMMDHLKKTFNLPLTQYFAFGFARRR